MRVDSTLAVTLDPEDTVGAVVSADRRVTLHVHDPLSRTLVIDASWAQAREWALRIVAATNDRVCLDATRAVGDA